jgi:anaerobic glycerol-3-phosphate dehydrogenase
MVKITNKRTKTARISAAPHGSAVEPIPSRDRKDCKSSADEHKGASEVERTRRELEAIRAKLPATPYSALDAKQRARFVELRAAMLAHREATKKARAEKTD